MYKNIFDTHAHYADAQYDADRAALLNRLHQEGICHVMLAGITEADSAENIRLAGEYDWMYASVGIHPKHVQWAEPGWYDRLGQLAEHERVYAIGEAGLDYSRSPKDKELQKLVFARQLELANDMGLPVILHIRDAMGDALEILRKYRPRGVAHCFGGSAETARELADLGLYFGIGGVLTYPDVRRLLTAIPVIPEDRLLLETDAPYLTPHPFRGMRNDSRFLALPAERMAALRGTDTQQMIDICTENAKALFHTP